MSIITKFKLFEKLITRSELLSHSVKPNRIEPALMTSKEYLTYLQAYKTHPDSAYQFSLSDDSKDISKEDLSKKFKLLNTIKHGSISIQYYVDIGYNFKDSQYVKRDDNGEMLRDSDGMAVLMTRDEIDKAGYTYDRNVIAVHNNKIVGSVQDEWGCVLVYVVKELKGIGIGEELTNFYRSYYPDKSSGGTTTGGFNNLKKYHAKQVKKYSRNGIYSDMVRNNEIEISKVKEIIKSILKINTNKKSNTDNIYSKYFEISNKYNRVFLFEGNDIMMINDDIIQYYKDYDNSYIESNNTEDIYENFIFGHTRIHIEDNGLPRLYFIDGKTKKDIIDLIGYAMSFLNMKYGSEDILYYITENTHPLVKDVIVNDLKSELFELPNRYKINIGDIDKNLINKLKEDTYWFYKLDDKYDEIKNRISENVYSTFQN